MEKSGAGGEQARRIGPRPENDRQPDQFDDNPRAWEHQQSFVDSNQHWLHQSPHPELVDLDKTMHPLVVVRTRERDSIASVVRQGHDFLASASCNFERCGLVLSHAGLSLCLSCACKIFFTLWALVFAMSKLMCLKLCTWWSASY